MSAQEFRLSMKVGSDYLDVHASELRSQDTVSAITMKVFHTAIEKNLSKILIDVRELKGVFGVMDIYFLVSEGLKDLRGKGVNQVAVIDIRRSTIQGWFLETVAQNRGFNLRVFAEEEAAISWLGG